ncbi:energy transducer TonB [Brevundimonas sp. GCM10030266]|uniref:energy transducer TonB n=1 Tax=Brevundimonas sp. GCM10030266 TaxID=3273386 RepID=UPI00360AFFC0
MAYALAAAGHAGLLVLISLQVAPPSDGGAAPVVNLTMEPSPRFDSETPPAAASTADQAAQTRAVPQPVAAPLRLRETTSTLPSEIIVPRPVQLASPTPRVQDAREAGDQQGVARSTEGQGSGVASTQSSIAGATQGGGGRTLGAAAAADTDVYFARVLAWIERHKRHPGDAQGVVTVSFRVDRRGRVSGLRLVRSSGVRALDRAALDQITSTQPFPRPDAGAQWATREFTVNIDYRTRRAG